MIADAEAANLVVRRDALAVLDPPHLELLEALELTPATAFARARLTVDLQNPQTVARAARQQLAAGSTLAYATWCEVARLADDPTILRTDRVGAAHPDLGDVDELLALRRATLGDRDESLVVPDGVGAAAEPIVVLCAGPADDVRTEFLSVTWAHFPPKMTVWTTALPHSALVRAAVAKGVPLCHSADRAAATARGRAHAIWRTILRGGGDPAKVRVLALPGADIDEILIARALGATVGRVETGDGIDLSRGILGGAADIVPLPDDRMTVRAFIRKSVWPTEMGDLESLARELHNSYVQRQREHNAAEGPALAPWESLLPWLQESNRAVVRDVPNKLAAIGLRLAAPGTPGLVDLAREVQIHMGLLAEQEHGRFIEERLTSGWTSGVRDPARFMSPHLKPWAKLEEAVRDQDRGVLHDLFAALTSKGIGAVHWQ
jgi:hypothetical protein